MKKVSIKFILLISFILITAGCVRQPLKSDYLTYPTQKVILSNGASFISRTVPDSKIICIEVLVKVGSASECEFLGSGISHFTEHMMFKANKKYQPGQIHSLVRNWGGFINGYTSKDITRYKIVILDEYLPQALRLMKDMLFDAKFDEELLNKEKEVILNEIKMQEDSPQYQASRLLFKTVYDDHPYALPIAGYEDKVKAVGRKELVKFYNKNYIPSNMIISVVGSRSYTENLNMLESIFALEDESRGSLSCRDYKVKKQITPKVKVKFYPTKLAYLNISFPGIDIKNKDLYALDILASILGSGGSSRLNKELNIDQGLVNWIGAYNYTPLDQGVFNIYASTDMDRLESTLKSIFKEIKKIKQTGISQFEINKAINRVGSSHIFELETIQNQASSIVISEFLTGDYDFDKKYIKNIEKLTKKDIIKVANKYLDDNKFNLTIVVPEGEDNKFIQSLLSNDYDLFYTGKDLDIDINTNFLDVLPKEATGSIPVEQEDPFKKFILSNGVTVLTKQDTRLPIVSLRCVFTGGVRAESQNNNGISMLTASLLLGGTSNQSKLEILNSIEQFGASIYTDSGYNSFSIGISTLSNNLDNGMDVLFDIIKNSNFPVDVIEKEKKQQQQAIMHTQDSIFDTGLKNLRMTLFNKHPYRFMKVGTIKSLENIKREDIVDFYNKHCSPQNMVLTVVGNISPDTLYEKINTHISNWKTDSMYQRAQVPKQDEFKGVNEKKAYLDKYQRLLMYGFRGIKITDEDRFALDVLTRIISGAGSRLWQSIREEEGLAYSLGAYFVPGVDPGYFVIYILTKSQDLSKIERIIKFHIEDITGAKFSEDEIQLAKNELIGNYISGLQSSANLAYEMSLDEIYGLGFDNFMYYPENITNVTKKDIIKVANKYITLNNIGIIKVLPKETTNAE